MSPHVNVAHAGPRAFTSCSETPAQASTLLTKLQYIYHKHDATQGQPTVLHVMTFCQRRYILFIQNAFFFRHQATKPWGDNGSQNGMEEAQHCSEITSIHFPSESPTLFTLFCRTNGTVWRSMAKQLSLKGPYLIPTTCDVTVGSILKSRLVMENQHRPGGKIVSIF